jgi:hypothetical protein
MNAAPASWAATTGRTPSVPVSAPERVDETARHEEDVIDALGPQALDERPAEFHRRGLYPCCGWSVGRATARPSRAGSTADRRPSLE